MYLTTIVGHGCRHAAAALAAKAQFDVASEVGLSSDGRAAAHTKGGGGKVSGYHVLDLAEGTAGRHNRAAHVTQDAATSSAQGSRESGKTTGLRIQRSGGEAPCGRGEGATQGAGVAGRLATLVDLATQITHVDVVAGIVDRLLLVRNEGRHLLYR